MDDDLQSVLLVDDDADIRTIADLSLGHVGGLQTLLAGSGREGALLAASARPDVILLDMMMPELDGLGTLALLRSDPVTAAIPVIFLTAKVQSHNIGDFAAAGSIGVIAKPFDPMTLAQEVRALVAAYAARV